ncbi:hypothetical protein [Acidovorax sp. sic0104]|uniref:hypothetical protein n=1 Tax=Acidovorax sp. sic0104 TaxID=2854784 RepID=UPI001C487947|nr:hypothetical protein [Acidovorax sp. sic0104]MBV7542062.1 hypothetical protein [Acidovorax sp. sic0104]
MGFVLACAKTYLAYRQCVLLGADTGGPGMKGLSFGIRAEVPEDFTSNYLGARSAPFGQSVDVSIGGSLSTGAGGRRQAVGGRTVQMFTPQDFENALASARAWVDKWFALHPEAIPRFNARQLEERAAAKAAS